MDIPKHIGIIMDGNGRWAKKRLLPVQAGHRAGMKALHKVVKAADELGVKILTVYAFSTENWKRQKDEVDYLMNLFVEYFIKEIDELDENNVQVHLIGKREGLPQKVLDAADEMQERTKDNTGLILNVALNYGGRDEIVTAVQDIIKEGHTPEEINEELISKHLYTGGLPDPDIMVRTAGERRISNFLLWQNSYAEFIFADELWPDCDADFLARIIEEYGRRDRRYGGRK